jgi:ABC-type glycerol-3-phosphate transport system permease component
MVTPASLVLPLYIMMERPHLSNTLFAVTVGITVLNLPFVVWLLKPFFDALPRECESMSPVSRPLLGTNDIAVPDLLSFSGDW